MKPQGTKTARLADASAPPPPPEAPPPASTASSTPTLDAIGNLHFFLEDHWDALLAECRTEAERARMRELQGWARDAYLQALADALDANASQIAQLQSNLAAVTRQVDGRLVVLQDITTALTLLTRAVTFAATVAGVLTGA